MKTGSAWERIRSVALEHRKGLDAGKRALRAVADAADALRDPHRSSAAAVSAAIGELAGVVVGQESALNTYLCGWERVDLSVVTAYLHDWWLAVPRRVLAVDWNENQLVEVVLEGHRLRRTWMPGDGFVSDVWAAPGEVAEVRRVMIRMFWAGLGAAQFRARAEDGEAGGGYRIEKADLSYARPSARADALAERIQRYIDAGHSRAYLLAGPPGTGKTCAAAHIAQRLGGRTFVIRPAVGLDTLGLVSRILPLAPRTVILDEMDRMPAEPTTLLAWDALRREVPVVLATVNAPDLLDYAMLRPGRFDDVLTFAEPLRDAAERVLSEMPPRFAERIRAQGWHRRVGVAYLAELARVAEVEGEAAATIAMDRLAEVAERLREGRPPSPTRVVAE